MVTHPRASSKGQWSTRWEHYPPWKVAFLKKTPGYCQELAGRIGPATGQVVEQLLSERPLDRLRSVQALLNLATDFGNQRLEAACQRALFFGDGRYRRIKEILNTGLDQAALLEPPPPAVSSTFIFQRTAAEFFAWEETRC